MDTGLLYARSLDTCNHLFGPYACLFVHYARSFAKYARSLDQHARPLVYKFCLPIWRDARSLANYVRSFDSCAHMLIMHGSGFRMPARLIPVTAYLIPICPPKVYSWQNKPVLLWILPALLTVKHALLAIMHAFLLKYVSTRSPDGDTSRFF